MNPKISDYFSRLTNWGLELAQLREIALACGLTEELKWRQPCYTEDGKNIAIIGAFKEYCAIMFFKGALLQDAENLLVSPGVNTQSDRQIRVTSVDQIEGLKETIKAYLFEAIAVEKADLKVDYKPVEALGMPSELNVIFDERPDLKAAFYQLTPGRQKGYLLHFSGAKQSKTRTDRIDKYTSRILDGKGLNDCVCGLSKRMPSCDGSHSR